VWRLRAVAFARLAAVCLLAALVAATFVVLCDKLIFLALDVPAAVGALFVAALPAAGVLLVWRGRIGRLRAAAEADRRLGLSDRLASAVELAGRDAWAEAIARDADERSRRSRPADVFPLTATWPMRLLAPAAIILAAVWFVPPLDLLGRMERSVARQVAVQVDAERTAGILAGADLPTPAADASGGVGALRVALVNVEKALADGSLDGARRIELSDKLRALAAQMAKEGADAKLTRAIQAAADTLANPDENAVALLRATQAELDRIDAALKEHEFQDEYAGRIAARTRAELMAGAADTARPAIEGAAEPDEDLVEVAASARRPADSGEPATGILYLPRDSQTPPADGWRTYDAAARAAERQITTGAVPRHRARLVRDYFQATEPRVE